MDRMESAARKFRVDPAPEPDPVGDLRRRIEGAHDLFAPSAIESLRTEVERLREDLRETAPRAAVREIGRALTHLHGQMSEVQAIEPARLAADLNDIKLCLGIFSDGEGRDGLSAAMEGLSRKVDLLNSRAVEPQALERLQAQIAELKDLVAHALEEGGALAGLGAASRADLMRVGEDVVQRIAVTGAAMERSTRDLIARLDEAPATDSTGAAIQEQLADLTARLTDLSEQVGAVGGAATLAEKVALLLERLEEKGEPQAETLQPLAEALERHVAVLAERVQISAEQQARLDGIEAHLQALTLELERFRSASADVSAEAVQAVAMRLSARDDAPAVIGLKRGLAALEARQQDFERRTRDFFAAEAELGLRDLADQEMVRPPYRAADPGLDGADLYRADVDRPHFDRAPAADRAADMEPHRFDGARPVFDGALDEADFADLRPHHFAGDAGLDADPAPFAESGPGKAEPRLASTRRPVVEKTSLFARREDRAIRLARRTSRKRAAANRKRPGIPPAGRVAIAAAALGIVILGAAQLSGPIARFAHAMGVTVSGSFSQIAQGLEARATETGPRTASAAPPAVAKAPPPVNAPALGDLPPPVGAPALRTAALAGNPAAAYEVGMRYVDGKGTDMNPVNGVKWLSYAVSKGSVPAAYQLGSLYEYTNRDVEQARALYSWAAERGNLRAMHNLGVLASEGVDGKSDWPAAIRWFRMAADLGLRDSQHNLGVIYSRGLGGAPDLGEAWKWFALAANQGDSESARKRDDIVARADAETLRRAQAAVIAFTPGVVDEAANTTASKPEWNQASPDEAAPRTVSAKTSG
ncbi:SEL1-like repeat protein [Roseixanthobacter glucoisosaccharinicivorans]|uniref:SEL1-like repeat protein n=1 Tax=Roseixanthobacter glucoisosaccharinicivorans TaxID=3119923 RepID=UPI00372951B4